MGGNNPLGNLEMNKMGEMFNNPDFMNMAMNMMKQPGMQNMMKNVMQNMGGGDLSKIDDKIFNELENYDDYKNSKKNTTSCERIKRKWINISNGIYG